MTPRTTLALLFTITLAACGGGGGGTDTAQDTDPVVAPATVASLLPGDTMTWSTRSEQTLVIELQDADGEPAAGAGVRVFTLSRSSPQGGEPLESPVPMSLLGSAASDASGRAALRLQLPAHVGEVLVKASSADAQGEGTVAVGDGPATVALTLQR
jgi:hypothetical protein